MEVSAISQLMDAHRIGQTGNVTTKSEGTRFDDLLQSMFNLVNETNDLTNKAEEEEIKYAAGQDNTLELMIAQNKANMSLSFTVAVRDSIIDAYKELMNLQF